MNIHRLVAKGTEYQHGIYCAHYTIKVPASSVSRHCASNVAAFVVPCVEFSKGAITDKVLRNLSNATLGRVGQGKIEGWRDDEQERGTQSGAVHVVGTRLEPLL